MFKVTIEETNLVTKKVAKYERIGEKEELREDRYITAESEKTVMVGVYGYLPEVETVVAEKRTILVQEVDTLDVTAVIKAINGLNQ